MQPFALVAPAEVGTFIVCQGVYSNEERVVNWKV